RLIEDEGAAEAAQRQRQVEADELLAAHAERLAGVDELLGDVLPPAGERQEARVEGQPLGQRPDEAQPAIARQTLFALGLAIAEQRRQARLAGQEDPRQDADGGGGEEERQCEQRDAHGSIFEMRRTSAMPTSVSTAASTTMTWPT